MAYVLYLKKGEECRLLAGHAWVYANEVARIEGKDKNGALAEVRAHDGRFIGRGYINHLSKILVRIFLRSEAEEEAAALERRIRAAVSLRKTLCGEENDCCRLIFAEADDLPALIVDRYGDVLVCELLSLGMDKRRELIADILERVCAPRGIYLRGDAPVRRKEGLPLENGVLRGEVPDTVVVHENGLAMEVDVKRGQKTGYFLDQKENRLAVRRYCRGARVLDCFCNSGGFSLNAAAVAKEVTAVDISPLALEQVRANAARNGFTNIRTVVRGRIRAAARLPRRGRKLRLRHPRPARLLQERGGGTRRLPRVQGRQHFGHEAGAPGRVFGDLLVLALHDHAAV